MYVYLYIGILILSLFHTATVVLTFMYIMYIPCYCTVYLLFYVFMVCSVCLYECIYYVLRRRTVITWT